MKKYLVSWNESITCYTKVKANTIEEAKEKALYKSHKNPTLNIDLIESDNIEVEEVKE